MLTIDDIVVEKQCAVFLGIIFAEDVLHIFEEKYPNDSTPREVINSVKKWLIKKDSNAIAGIVNNAYIAVNTIYCNIINSTGVNCFSYDYYAAYAVSYAADSASYLYLSNSIKAAKFAANNAANAKNIESDLYINQTIKRNLSSILQFHIEEEISFKNPEKILMELSDVDRESFIFNLNILGAVDIN